MHKDMHADMIHPAGEGKNGMMCLHILVGSLKVSWW